MRRILLLALALVPAASAQSGITLRDNRDFQLDCSRSRGCEIREEATSSTGNFAVEGIHNGEVTVRGWTRPDVRVRFRVRVDANSERETREVMQRIRTRVSPGRVTIDGPTNSGSFLSWMWEPTWEVSAEVFVPQNNSVRVSTHNGALMVSDLSGRVEARSHNGKAEVERIGGDVRAASHNGEVRLTDIGGNVDYESHNGSTLVTRVRGSVRGTSHNGRTEVELAGASSTSRRVEVENHNGEVILGLPRNFSAHVRSESHHGQLNSDFPAPRKARDSGDDVRDFKIGSGEASVRIRTHNGGVRLRAL